MTKQESETTEGMIRQSLGRPKKADFSPAQHNRVAKSLKFVRDTKRDCEYPPYCCLITLDGSVIRIGSFQSLKECREKLEGWFRTSPQDRPGYLAKTYDPKQPIRNIVL